MSEVDILPISVRSQDDTVLEVPTPRQVLRIAINLKYLIDSMITRHYNDGDIDAVITEEFVTLAYKACGGDEKDTQSSKKYQAVIVFALLNVYSWYQSIINDEIHEINFFITRSIVVQKLCQIIIEREEKKNIHYLFNHILLRRYSIFEIAGSSNQMNAVELATDLHCTIIVGTSGFQRCLVWLWDGWIIQSPKNLDCFIKEEIVVSTSYLDHFTPQRIKTPKYQNFLTILFSVIYLILYSTVMNEKLIINIEPINKKEFCFILFTLGYVIDEIMKFHYIGIAYFQFWTCFNDSLYLLVTLSIILRLKSLYLSNSPNDTYGVISYRLLACAVPLAWSRLLLYLESQKFIGIMLVVVKHMMRESIIFFFLLILLLLGFLQGFIALDLSDGELDVTNSVINNLLATIIGFGDLSVFENFASPYATILYYCYSFVISVILLNILIALYSNAYQNVVDNADSEYMCLMSQKTLRFIRAPDENVFVPPCNIFEIILSLILLGQNEAIKQSALYVVMTLLYAPLLIITSLWEVRTARRIKYNRLWGVPDDSNQQDTIWDLTDGYVESVGISLRNDAETGIKATLKKNSTMLIEQSQEEKKDPKFSVTEEWYDRLEKLKNTSNNPQSTLLKLLYEQNKNIIKLTKKIEKLDRKLEILQQKKKD
ncbi:similar to Saccharomyces cerevisiae YOR087W YVC1 Vacuolar cation channel, mediates release of Ca(2+) from the vacuole in response to hyperosmotic shock [Maudiozyma barnettii]|uniref:Similar to Saccharomyces cerevisiae YOR087W YVC1 Vacuolar cation channel, mediates release of Ca(2+) from the vacuole in response to hyperosmotic shock n=1 Tax=Maudiozyma barnettii TaxID=61262 RepID=A0A8H2ZGF5_9SACH|nr:Yvc1p [Kazachstania barnettii]CAB4253264.1 similar to Saccharomyces cerevisiae YOR087W YVC1 Vacuolar cation channel, mediates release of Ca(2+) from the vacuole in response to hyperosmotic shock [Kazachstania barnettii]CAD1780200.1 similar to Saccharomyces cerevisiae YOR087W YVC1 Vacuolar cation channel, mediates release of Ca(2+) from the vacuole in response to hyperosmotic shock [Kazachstania barnettii]